MVTTLIGYARVSTAEQRLHSQTDALAKAGCAKVFSDIVSGSTTSRPELDKCLGYLREGDVLVVYKLDRLGRSLKHLLTIIDDLKERGIGFKSISDNIDTTTVAGQLMFSVMGAFAEFERSLIRERTNAGLKAARDRGRLGGRPTVVDEAKGQQIIEMRAAGSNAAAIAKELGIGRGTVYRYLQTQRELIPTL